ncbi:PASTA domain-containing protein [Cryobacterium frigoriphilum]|uniref:PASTA domain-containing protein n=1 Tax=Cryobacterium frigoriphilum TaxID=1259150 RepID=UPI00141BAC60|nr:PASTA domain-containing protein [Cryobacterium frigoriphilum]
MSSRVVQDQHNSSRWTRFRAHPKFRRRIVLAAACLLVIGAGISWLTVEAQKVVVPDLAGLSVPEAGLAASELELGLEPDSPLPTDDIQKFTTISTQNPIAGARVFPGTVVSFDFDLDKVEIPDIGGMPLTDAQKVLAANGLSGQPAQAQLLRLESGDPTGPGLNQDASPVALAALAEQLDVTGDVDFTGAEFALTETANVDSWTVTTVSPSAGQSVRAGSDVSITLALPITQVPDLAGMPSAEALSLLKQVGLSAKQSSEPSYGGPLPAEFKLDLAYLEYSYWGSKESATLTAKLGKSGTWLVDSQSAAPGDVLLIGDAVDVRAQWPTAVVPDLAGKTGDEAKQALNDLGFSGYALPLSSTGIVRSQVYAAGTVMPVGAQIEAQIGHEFSFAITSSASRGMITWAAPGTFSIQQANGESLPWTKTWYPSSVPSVYERGNFNAQMNSGDGWITCEIIVDGEVVQTKTSTGAYSVVSCG